MEPDKKIIQWLLDGDPSIRWQTYKDLLDADDKTVNCEREKISKESWGAKLLSFQDDAGTWAESLYSRKWISTTYTLLLLQSLGLLQSNKQAIKACKLMLDKGFYSDNGINLVKSWKRSETCITGMTLSLLCYFNLDDERIHEIIRYIENEQMEDGGWNCLSFQGATHSSFNTTIIVLEGLREYEKRFEAQENKVVRKQVSKVVRMQEEAREFLLQHKLFKSHRTGEVADSKFTRLSYPPRWHYDILRALDYFRECKAGYDVRMDDAIELLKKKQNPDGTWQLQQKYPGKVWFDMEKIGKPSRWNTLRALRVLKFFNN
ncbi:MAG: hypothetical protein C4539_13225 [Ignavibacteriales bacterium]|nr:MAG: hypothetical protein C4539_13225 [Ignavibacteriales bacterium]